jgi:hypothetical protein
LLKSSFAVNLFAKSTKEIFNDLDLNGNTLLANIIKYGVGIESFYKQPQIEQETPP